MRHPRYDCNFGCPVEACLETIGGKWKGVILYHLLDGSRRFNELMRLVPAVTQRMLTRQLRELEAAQIVERKVYPEVPPRVEYSLTEFGRTLKPNGTYFTHRANARRRVSVVEPRPWAP